MKLQDFKIGEQVYNNATGTVWTVVNINGSDVTVMQQFVITGKLFNEYSRWGKIDKGKE